MSAEIIPSDRSIERLVPLVLFVGRNNVRDLHIEQTAESDRLIKTAIEIGLFIDPEVV